MSKRVIFIEHDHVSEGGPIWHQFKVRGYEITRFIIVDKDHQKSPNVTVEWPDLLTFDVVVVMGAPYAAYGDDVVGNWLLPELEKMKEVHNAGIPVLGICFGGQLMSRVLGGTVSRSPRAELGWYEIESKKIRPLNCDIRVLLMFFIDDYETSDFITSHLKLMPDRTTFTDVVVFDEDYAFAHF